MTKMLQQKGYVIDIANNGIEALDLHSKGKYDLILMDIQMPVMDGLETARIIRDREGTGKHTAIIALTAHALQGDRERFMSLGMDEYLAKPIQIDDLFHTIEKMTYLKEKDLPISGIRVDGEGNIIIVQDQMVGMSESQYPLVIEIEEKIIKLIDCLEDSNLEILGELAHEIKKLCNRIGADELKSLAFQIELAVRRNNSESIINYSIMLKQEFETFKDMYFGERKDIL
jgi:CheY-like chemotaxis protein